jgi:hypothetical protein
MTILEVQSFMIWLTGEDSLFNKAEKLTTEQAKLWQDILAREWVTRKIAYDAARELKKVNKGRSPNFEVFNRLLDDHQPGRARGESFMYSCFAVQGLDAGKVGQQHSFTLGAAKVLSELEIEERAGKYAARLKQSYGGVWTTFTNVDFQDIIAIRSHIAQFGEIPAREQFSLPVATQAGKRISDVADQLPW